MLYLSGIILAFFLSLVLVAKRNKADADYILMAWLAVTGFHLLTFYLRFTDQHLYYPGLIGLGLPLPLAQGPFLFLYTRQQTSPYGFRWRQLLHFIPVALSYLLFAKFYLLPFEQKVEVFRHAGQGFKLQITINLYALYVSGVVYTILSLIRLLRHRKNMVHQFSNLDKVNFNWLLHLIIWLMVIWLVILIIREDKWIFGAASLFVLWLGFFGIRQAQIFSQNPIPSPVAESSSNDIPRDEESTGSGAEKPAETGAEEFTEPAASLKYQKSSLSENDAALIQQRLHELMAEQKPFTNPDLTLNELAKMLAVHPNNLSQVINSLENKNFNDFINEQRVEEFIKCVSDPGSRQFTLLALAFDCGFSSKASFNRNFKKYTSLSPREYLKQVPEEV